MTAIHKRPTEVLRAEYRALWTGAGLAGGYTPRVAGRLEALRAELLRRGVTP